MPAQVYNLQIVIDAKNNASPKLQQAGKDMTGFGKAASGVNSTLGSLGLGLSMAGLVTVAGAAGTAMVKLAMDAEQTEVAFTTLIGSTAGAQEHLDELRAFAASTPFQFTDLTEASKKMMAFGFESERVIPMLTAIGDAVAAMGGTSANVDRVTLALGQMQAKGKVSAGEMLQLTEAGIPAWGYLADAIGVSTGEVMKMSERGLIPAGDAINYILAGMEKDFGGMMAAQSQTAAGKLSNLTDQLQLLGTTLGDFSLPVIGGGIEMISGRVGALNLLNQAFKDGAINVGEYGQTLFTLSVLGPDASQEIDFLTQKIADQNAVLEEEKLILESSIDAHDRLAASTEVNVAGAAAFAAETATLNTVWQSYGPTISDAVLAQEALRQTLIPLTGAASDLKFGMGELTTTNLFYAASAGLSDEAAYEMAVSMGLVSEESAAAKAILDELRTQLEDGTITTAEYTSKVGLLNAAINSLPDGKVITIEMLQEYTQQFNAEFSGQGGTEDGHVGGATGDGYAAISAQVDAAGAGGDEVVIEGGATGAPFSAGGAMLFNESPSTTPEVIVASQQGGGYILTRQDAQAALAGAYGRGSTTYNVTINDQLAAKLFLEELRRREMVQVDGMM